MNVTLSPAVARVGHVRELIARSGALIFDVDGTLAETEEVHRRAFNEAFKQVGLGWCWGVTIYKGLLQVTGGKERIRAFDRMRLSGSPLSDATIADLHRIKTDCYAALIARGDCSLRPGVRELIAAALRRGQRLAIATTTSRPNVDALLSVNLGADWERGFDAVVAGDEVARKKPDPDVYIEALARLGLPPLDCFAIEDSGNGVVSASRAGIPVVVTRSAYFRDEDFSGALLAIDDLTAIL